MKLRKTAVISAALVLILVFSSVPTMAASARATYYRGSFLMWTRDNVDFNYKNGKITSSSGFQQSGWIFPNISRNKEIKRTSKSSTCHKWRAVDVIGAGVPTPWGDVKVYSSEYVHRLVVKGNGSWSAWAD